MAGVAAPNLPSFMSTAATVTSRNAEYTGTPLADADGSATYADPYLGCNRAGACAPGIGISSGEVSVENGGTVDPAKWTTLDQNGAARTPQDTSYIGNTGFVDRSSTAWPSSGGASGNPTQPVLMVDGTDFNNEAEYLAATQNAADGAVFDTTTGAVNRTGAAIVSGDILWGVTPVA